MTRFGYTLMCEQSGPRDLVRDAARAEQAGFDFEVISDHYSPWLDSQGHAPNAWATLGRGRSGDRTGRADDLRDLPDHALSPGRRRAAGRDRRPAQRRPVHARAGRGREPQRARHRARLAAGQHPPRDAGRGDRDHPRALRRRLRQLSRASTSGSTRPSSGTSAHRRRGSASPSPVPQSMRTGRPLRRRDDRGRARPVAQRRSSTRPAVPASPGSARCRSAGTRPRRRDRPRPRPVPLVRRRLEGQRRAPGHRRVRSGQPVRPQGRHRRRRSRADPTSMPMSRRCRSSSMPASPTSPSCRSAATPSPTFLDWAEHELLPALRRSDPA